MAPLTIAVAIGVLAAAALLARAVAAPGRSATRRRADELRPARGPAGRLARSMSAVVARSRRGRDGPAADGLASVLEDIARGVRAGSSLHRACADAAIAGGPAAAALATAVGHADRGQPLATAFARWAATSTTPDDRLAAGALALAASAGGPQARAVDGVAATLRERRAMAAEVRAQSAQARLSAVVIAALPALFLAWALATDRRTAAFLVAPPAGWICLAAGAGLEAGGALWMRRLLRGAAP